MVPRHFLRIAIVTGVLPSRYSEIRRAITKMAKSNTILKNTYYDTKQTDKAREQKLRREAAVIGEALIKYEC